MTEQEAIANQQKFVDILYELQCCIATQAFPLKLEDEIGNSCYSKDFLKIAELEIILDHISCYNINEPDCLTKDEIKKILNYLKRKCNNCCLEIKSL